MLRALRTSTRLGQGGLASTVGVSQAQYSRIEAGSQTLTTEQWLAIAPKMALGLGNQRTWKEADLRYVICSAKTPVEEWNPWSTDMVRDDLNQVGVFVSGDNACRTAGTLELFGLGRVWAICSTPTALQDALFRFEGDAGERTVDTSRRSGASGRASAAVLNSLDFAVGAVQRVLGERDAATERAITQARR